MTDNFEERKKAQEERKRQIRKALVKADFNADQAWAGVRDILQDLISVREKIRSGTPLEQLELEIANIAVSLVIGEIYLREAKAANTELGQG